MPKKFRGTNTKAEAAKERKQAIRQDTEDKRKLEEEDALWKDDGKHVARKQERKVEGLFWPVLVIISSVLCFQDERERRRVEQLERKKATQQLLEEEDAKTVGKSHAAAPKKTHAEIQEATAQITGATASAVLPKGVVEAPVMEENPNQLLKQRQLEEGEVDARSVEEAITVLGGAAAVEKHPEKRVKAAYAAYEERELPRLKAENPNLRLSQLKQILRKDWMKSPENPLNQHFQSFNAKP